MGYVLIALTILASAGAVAGWLRILSPRVQRMKQPDEFGNRQLNPFDGVWIIGNGRPDPFRTFVNSGVVGLCVFMFGIPHFLAIAQFWLDPNTSSSHFLHYAWSLAWWAGLLAIPCFIFLRTREAKARRKARDSAAY